MRVRTVADPSNAEFWVEDILSVTARPNAVVDHEREDNGARASLAIGNVFTISNAPKAVAVDSIARAAVICSEMTDFAVRLFGAMISRGPRHAGRQRQR